MLYWQWFRWNPMALHLQTCSTKLVHIVVVNNVRTCIGQYYVRFKHIYFVRFGSVFIRCHSATFQKALIFVCIWVYIHVLLSLGARSPYCLWPLLVWCPAGGHRLGGSGWHCVLHTCCHTCYGICGLSACCWIRLVLDLINASDVQWKLQYLALDDAESSVNQKWLGGQLYVSIPSTGSTLHQFQDFGN